MKVHRPHLPVTDQSSSKDVREWADRIARCSVSCAKTIESRKLRPNEVPLVLGALVTGLSDQTGLNVDVILGMVKRAAVAKELPENSPNETEA